MIKRSILLGSALVLFASYASSASAMLSKCKREEPVALSLHQSHVNQLFLNSCEIGDLNLVQRCVEVLGADRDARCNLGFTGRHHAALNDNLDVLKYLLKNHDYPEDNRNDELTPFHLALKGDYDHIIRWYCEEKRLKFNWADGDGINLLHMTAFHGAEKCSRYLLSKLSCSKTQPKDVQDSFGVACKVGNFGVAKILLPYVDINKPAHRGSDMTLVYLLAGTGNFKGVKFLMENGANPELRTKEGFVAIQAAKTGGFPEIVELLSQYSLSKHLSEDIFSSEGQKTLKKRVEKSVLLPKQPQSDSLDSQKAVAQIKNGKENKKPQLLSNVPSGNSVYSVQKSAKAVTVNDFVHIAENNPTYKKSSIFLFPNNAQQGTYYLNAKESHALIEVPQDLDNVGAQLSSNHLAYAGYSTHVKEKMALTQDIFHNFSPTIEKKHGHLAQTNIIDFKLYPAKKQYWKEQLGKSMPIENRWFELHCQIPAQIRPSVYSVDKAKAQGPTGFIKYVVLAEGLADHHEKTIVHRCFEISKK